MSNLNIDILPNLYLSIIFELSTSGSCVRHTSDSGTEVSNQAEEEENATPAMTDLREDLLMEAQKEELKAVWGGEQIMLA